MKRTLAFYAAVTMCLLPIVLLRDYTPSNELRYISIADEALREGHLFAFTNHGVPYADKPPLFLWLVMLVRLAPAALQHLLLGALTILPAFITIEVTGSIMRFQGRKLMLLRLTTLTTGLYLVSMLTLRMDMLMCMFIMLAIRQFQKCYESRRPHESPLLMLFIFLAVFTKGPFGALIPLAVIIAFLSVKGRLGDFFKFLGWRSWLLVAILTGSWFGAVYAEGGGDYLSDLVFHQTIDRAYHSFHHREPFYYYLYMMWPLLLPWTFAMLHALWLYLRKKPLPQESLRLMTIGCAATFVILSLVSAKLSIYFLPFVPFAAALATNTYDDCMPAWPLATGFAVFLFPLPLIVLFKQQWPDVAPYINVLTVMALAIMATAAIMALMALHKHRELSAISLMAAGVLGGTLVAGFSFTRINAYIGFKDVCSTAQAMITAHHANKVVAVDMKRAENMDVYLGCMPEQADSAPQLKDCHHAVVMASAAEAHRLPLHDRQQTGDKVVGYLP